MFSQPSNELVTLPYYSSDHCQASLVGVEAIDYFFAKRMLSLFSLRQHGNQLSDDKSVADSSQNSQFFHVLLALSFYQRQGHSCLDLTSIASQKHWTKEDTASTADTQDADTQDAGFLFADQSQLDTVIAHYIALAADEMQYIEAGQVIDISKSVYLVYEKEAKNLFTARMWQYETDTARALSQLIVKSEEQKRKLQSDVPEALAKLWPMLFAMPELEVNWQEVAVLNGLSSHFSIISGGAGTGKTYTSTRLLIALTLMLKQNGVEHPRILLAAPTGKAAQRLSESIELELTSLNQLVDRMENTENGFIDLLNMLKEQSQATTLHRLLGIGFNSIEAKYHHKKPLNCDVLLVDEVSMIDTPMMAKMVRALPKHARLILLGDANQLPSVESGSVLRDLVSVDSKSKETENLRFSNYISQQHAAFLVDTLGTLHSNAKALSACRSQLVTLTAADNNQVLNHVTFLLQGQRSIGDINVFANAILENDHAQLSLYFEKQADLFTNNDKAIEIDDGAYLNEFALKQYQYSRIAEHYDAVFSSPDIFTAMDKILKYRCLTPTNNGAFGIVSLNQQIEIALQKKHKHIQLNKAYKGLPIMVVQNDYKLHLFNGDIGLLWPDENGRLKAWFVSSKTHASAKGQLRSVSYTALPRYERVYAMTIHKTQGSEFETIDIVLPKNTSEHVTRELLYTGVTRAKRAVRLICSKAALLAAASRSEYRASGLAEKLKEFSVNRS